MHVDNNYQTNWIIINNYKYKQYYFVFYTSESSGFSWKYGTLLFSFKLCEIWLLEAFVNIFTL